MTRTLHAFVIVSSLLGAGSACAESVRLPYQDIELLGDLRTPSPGGLADGVVVLVHGTLAHHRMELIETLQSQLEQRGLNTLAITLSLGVSARGGMYDCGTPHRHRHTDAVEEIGTWMRWLAARGAGPVTLLGHSRGGNQVARFALAHPAALQSLVLVAPATFDSQRAGTRYAAGGGPGLDAIIEKARTSAPDAWLTGIPFLYCSSAQVTAASFLSYYVDDAMQDTPALLPRIAVRTLVVAGGADTTVPDAAARTAPHVDQDTVLVVVDGADHFFRDLYADDLVEAVTSFIGKH